MTDSSWEKCIEFYNRLKMTRDLASPFSGFVPPDFHDSAKRILYVGKATRGDCQRGRFDHALSLGTCEAFAAARDFSRGIFESNIGTAGASFWGFANDLSKSVDPSCKVLGNLAWSNLCRIGVKEGNPDADLIGVQAGVCALILQAEIASLSPHLVVFVTNNFASQILLTAIDNPPDKAWEKSEDSPDFGVTDVWWQGSRNDKPGLLWMRHPQFSTSHLREFAIAKAVELVN